MKATQEEIAKVLDDAIASMKADVARITEKIQFVCEMHWRCCKVGVMPTIDYCGISFQNCERDEVLAVMKAFGGKWDKSPHYSGQGIDYTQWLYDYKRRLEISNAKPPASCQVVEEEVEIPAQPARMEKRFKLQCVKPIEGETTPLPVPDPSQVQSVTDSPVVEIEDESAAVETTTESTA